MIMTIVGTIIIEKIISPRLGKYKVREDLYKSRHWDGLKTLDKAVNDSWYNFRIGDKVYEQARVTVYHIAQKTEYLYFNSNEEAIRYIDNLKIRCKEVGNELK